MKNSDSEFCEVFQIVSDMLHTDPNQRISYDQIIFRV